MFGFGLGFLLRLGGFGFPCLLFGFALSFGFGFLLGLGSFGVLACVLFGFALGFRFGFLLGLGGFGLFACLFVAFAFGFRLRFLPSFGGFGFLTCRLFGFAFGLCLGFLPGLGGFGLFARLRFGFLPGFGLRFFARYVVKCLFRLALSGARIAIAVALQPSNFAPREIGIKPRWELLDVEVEIFGLGTIFDRPPEFEFSIVGNFCFAGRSIRLFQRRIRGCGAGSGFCVRRGTLRRRIKIKIEPAARVLRRRH